MIHALLDGGTARTVFLRGFNGALALVENLFLSDRRYFQEKIELARKRGLSF